MCAVQVSNAQILSSSLFTEKARDDRAIVGYVILVIDIHYL